MLNAVSAPQGGTRPQADATPVVYVVDDDVSVRESLELLIRFAGWQPVLFDSARAFLDQPAALVPSCLVLDVNLPDLNGLELQRSVAGERPAMPIIFITGYGDVPLTVRAMKAGAVEFLTKPFDDDTLLRAIAEALAHSHVALQQQERLRTLRAAYASLTPRERDVLRMVVAGRLNKQVAADLGISEITVKAHRGRAMRKMKARSLPDLVKMAALLEIAADGER
ncbi:response regulator [Pseudomonas citronellolis]|uniref:response regulator transcription factor n=1 Tax=Pseudomonas citronellolis TaxID=53408 RepID=UPI002110FF52|nr:response regulator [Pseudomonas citronellolis]UUC53314.1 response regulator [Pseudomonas citronellolis]